MITLTTTTEALVSSEPEPDPPASLEPPISPSEVRLVHLVRRIMPRPGQDEADPLLTADEVGIVKLMRELAGSNWDYDKTELPGSAMLASAHPHSDPGQATA